MFPKRRDAISGRLTMNRAERQVVVEAARSFRKAPTRSEAILWQALRGGQLRGYRFRRQHQIGTYIVDFCCVARRLIVEIDGPVHDGRQEEDKARQQALEARGYAFLRVPATQVEHNLPSVLVAIHTTLADKESP